MAFKNLSCFLPFKRLSARSVVLVFFAILSIIGRQTEVMAANIDPFFCESNPILYSCVNPCTTGPDSGGSGTGTATPNASGSGSNGLTAQQQAFVDQYHDIAEKLSIEYGIPWEAVMAQGILESAAGTSDFAVNRNNFFGINAVDDNPGQATSFTTAEDGWRGYYDFIADNRRYRENGVFQGDTVTNPEVYLQAIWGAGYATDPEYVSKNMNLVNKINAYAKEKGWDSSADLAKKHAEMLSNADKNAQGSNSSPSPTTGPDNGSSGCAGGAGSAGNGSIVDIANNMGTWGQQYQACYEMGGGHGSTEDLQNRIDHNFTSGYGIDCSGFTRAVIYQATGKDPGAMSTSVMCASPDVYEHIPRAEAQPGDLAIDCPNHVEVITAVNSDGSFSTVGSHSSGCGPGNGPSPSNYQGTEGYVLRYKG